MDLFVIASALLGCLSLTNLWTCSRWPRAGRDSLLALLGAAIVGVYLVENKTHEIAILLTITHGHGLTVADLFAIPCMLSSSLLMGRTVLLRLVAASAQVPHPSVTSSPLVASVDHAPANLLREPVGEPFDVEASTAS